MFKEDFIKLKINVLNVKGVAFFIHFIINITLLFYDRYNLKINLFSAMHIGSTFIGPYTMLCWP